MESSFVSVSQWDYFNSLILRPVLAISFAVSLISLAWFLAWNLVLVHVPLVQEIFGLHKKPNVPKPPTRRLSKLYSTINARNPTTPLTNSFGSAADGVRKAEQKRHILLDPSKEITCQEDT